MISLGRVGDPARGRQTFQHYVEETWLPNHEVEPSTRERYWYCLYRHNHAGVRIHADDRRPPRACAGVGNWAEGPWGEPGDDRREQGHPQRDLHHRSERPGDVPASVQRREDTN